jgi:hypothetical protein
MLNAIGIPDANVTITDSEAQFKNLSSEQIHNIKVMADRDSKITSGINQENAGELVGA